MVVSNPLLKNAQNSTKFGKLGSMFNSSRKELEEEGEEIDNYREHTTETKQESVCFIRNI